MSRGAGARAQEAVDTGAAGVDELRDAARHLSPETHPLASAEAKTWRLRGGAEGQTDIHIVDGLLWEEGVVVDLDPISGEPVARVVRTVAPVDRVSVAGDAAPPVGTSQTWTRVDPLLIAAVATAGPGAVRRAWFEPWDDPGSGMSASAAVELAMFRGEVQTWDDVYQVRREAIRARQRRAAEVGGALAEMLTSRGLVVELVDGTTGRVLAAGAFETIQRVWVDDAVASVEAPLISEDDCGLDPAEDGGESVNGQELREYVQTRQFHDAGFLGEGLVYGLREGEGHLVFYEHEGFLSGAGARRYFNCASVVGPAAVCDDVLPPTNSQRPHSTAVASFLIGDVSQGQDSLASWPVGSLESQKRSGMARGAVAFGFRRTESGVNFQAFDAALAGSSLASQISVVNQSSSSSTAACGGTESESEHVNAMFEDGIAWFNSSSNADPPTGAACNVGAPGAALGVFAVNAHAFGPTGEPITNGSTATGGWFSRTILSMAAPTNLRHPYAHYDRPLSLAFPLLPIPDWYGADYNANGFIWQDDDSDGAISILEKGGFNGSSASTPVVAGAAGLLRDQYLTEIGTNITNPGVLYATMLLMGDRTSGTGTTLLDTGFDNRWGAGVLKMRMLNAAGLDWPAQFKAGSVCVGDNESVTVHISHPDVSLPQDVDVLKLVTWTYSPGHDDGGAVPDVDLRLFRGSWDVGTQSVLWQLPAIADDLSGDNKKRVFVAGDDATGTDVGGRFWKFSVSGADVGTGGWPNCAQDRVRVWYAWMYEDDNREAGDVPECVGSEVTP